MAQKPAEIIRIKSKCWAALTSHEAQPDAALVYAVRTTKVYCRSGCTSRLPRRECELLRDTGACQT